MKSDPDPIACYNYNYSGYIPHMIICIKLTTILFMHILTATKSTEDNYIIPDRPDLLTINRFVHD